MTRGIRQLGADSSGLALMEFALMLPFLVTLGLGGAELTNYVTVRMRMSQIALSVADNAARMGYSTGGPKTVSESDVNDVFAGAQTESAGLDVGTNGRIILSNLVPTTTTPVGYTINWQRCYGNQTGHASRYGVTGANLPTGIGPTGNQVTAGTGNATMFVEVYYVYKPLVMSAWAPTLWFDEIASMAVRDNRDNTQVYPAQGVTASTC